MTQTLTSGRVAGAAGRAGDTDQIGSVWVRGAFAALSSAAIGIAALVVLVLAAWAADSRSGATAGAAIRTALQLWLLGHRVPLSVPGGTVALSPLGLTALLGLLLVRAAGLVGRGSRCSTLREVGVVAAAVAGPYTVILTAVAVVAGTPGVGASPVLALLLGAVVSGLAAAVGASRGTGLARQLWRSLPAAVRDPATAGAAGLAVITGAAALLCLVSLAVHAGAEQRALSRYPGVTAEVALGLGSLLLLPNAVGFGLSYVAGSGFAVGQGTAIGFSGSNHGRMPAFPLLAAVPSGTSVAATAGCLVGIVAGGVVTGWLLTRRGDPPMTERLRDAAAAAAVAGCGAAAVAMLSGGPAGPGRMSAVGPSPWQAGLAVALEIGVLALLYVLVRWWLVLARSMLRRGGDEQGRWWGRLRVSR